MEDGQFVEPLALGWVGQGATGQKELVLSLPLDRLDRDVASIAATNAFISLGGVVSGILVARMLGPVGRGDWAIILLWPGIVGYIGTFGADVVIGRRVAQSNETAPQYATLSVVLALLSSALLLIPAFFILPYIIGGERQYLLEVSRLALVAIPGIILSSHLCAVALGAYRLRVFNIGRLSATIGYIALIAFLWMEIGGSIASVAIAYLASVWGSACLMYYLFVRAQRTALHLSFLGVLGVVRDGLSFAPGYVLFAITNNLSTLWLWVLSDSRSLGLYVVAMSFASVQYVVSHALAKTAFRTAAVIDCESYASAIGIQISRSFITLSVLAIFLMIAAPWFVPWLFGPRFSVASSLVLYLGPGVAFFALAQVMEEALKAKGISTASVYARVSCGAIVSICALILIPRIGADGMALSYLMGGIVECSVFLGFLYKRLGLTVADLTMLRAIE